MAKEAIRFENVSYAYGRGTPFCKVAADHIDLSIREGVITGIIGHTGSGKSTVLQLMNGLLRPDEGRVYVQGEDIWAKPKEIQKVAFKVGLVFQYPEYQLFEETVEKDVAFGPKNMGLPKEEIARRVKEALQFTGIGEELAESSPFDLSGGQKRRVAIAGVIAMQPEVLVLDEPAAGLDPRGREEIFSNVQAYQRTTGKTVVIVSHSMEDMARYAEDLIVMNEGKPVLSGSCKEVFAHRAELEKTGLAVPQITTLMERLRELGMPVSSEIYTVEEAKNALLPLLEGGKKHA